MRLSGRLEAAVNSSKAWQNPVIDRDKSCVPKSTARAALSGAPRLQKGRKLGWLQLNARPQLLLKPYHLADRRPAAWPVSALAVRTSDAAHDCAPAVRLRTRLVEVQGLGR